MVAVAAAHHAAHVDMLKARPGGLKGHARQILRVIVEVRDVQFLELPGVERLNADRHVLHIFRSLLGGDHHLLQRGRVARIRGISRLHAGE